jgi:hypothetical protein
MCDTIPYVVFNKKIKSFKVISPLLLLDDPEVDEEAANRRLKALWKDDLVHMAAEGYSDLVDSLLELVATISFPRVIPPPDLGGACISRGNIAKAAFRRKERVNSDDTLAPP